MTAPDANWPRALALLDDFLALPAEQRDAWLAAAATREPAVAPLLNRLLQAHGRVVSQELLATLPKLQRPALALSTTDSGAPGLRVGPFELIEPLGRGGMGSVWRARHADGTLKRDVAIKLPSATDDGAALATLRERFSRERDFLAQLTHPHIARLYDAGFTDTGQPYLAMEYVAGQAIDAWCDAQRLSVRGRLQLFLQVLDAVGHAHQQLVLHRDLKPGNVLVDAQGQVRLLDFGVARLLPPVEPAPADSSPGAAPPTELTERVGAAFTLAYAAPEQITRGALSTATDVYALGAMLYRLLTGLSPYQPARDSRGALEDAVLLTAPQQASARAFEPAALAARQASAAGLRHALRGDLDLVLAQALKKAPAERYPTVGALADDLRRHLARQPVSARPDSWRYRSRLFIARHRLALAGVGLATVALAATAGVAAWQAKQSTRYAERAIQEAARANSAQRFFAGLLAKADPEHNRQISAVDRQTIDQALATAERDFADAPDTLAVVLRQLGEIYTRLGVPDKVLAVQTKRVALLATLPGAVLDEQVDAQMALGKALADSDDPALRSQALAQLQQARDIATTHPVADALRVKTLCMLADHLLSEGQYQTADAQAAQALAHARATLKSPHPVLSLALEQQAVTATRLGQFDVATQAYRQAIAVDATGGGRGAVEQLKTRANLANTEYLAGSYLAARSEALAALEFAQGALGAMEGTLTPLRVRAVLASERAGLLDEAATLAARLLGPDLGSPDAFRVGRAQFVIGLVALSRGELAAADRAFSAAEPGLVADARWHRSLLSQQALLLIKRGQPRSALVLLTPVIAQVRRESDGRSEELAKLAEPAGVVLARQGRLDEARALFDDACAWRRATLTPAHPNRVRCESYLLLADGQADAARQHAAVAAQLALLQAGREDQLALVGSLRQALVWIRRPEADVKRSGAFPLLE